MAEVRGYYQRVMIPELVFENEELFWSLLEEGLGIDKIFHRLFDLTCENVGVDKERFSIDLECTEFTLSDEGDDLLVFIKLPYVRYAVNLALYIAIYFKEGEKTRLFYGEADKELSLALFVVELEYCSKWQEDGFSRINYGILDIHSEFALHTITHKPDIRLELNEYLINEEVDSFINFVAEECFGGIEKET